VATELGLEPVLGILLGDEVLVADTAGSTLLAGHTVSRAGQHNVEVHAINANARVILDAQIDVLIDTKAEVTRLGEVAILQLELLDGQTLLQDLLGLLATNSDVGSDLLISADTEGTHGQTSSRQNGLLVSQLLQHTGSTSQTITALTNAAVDDKLLDEDLAHRFRLLLQLLGLFNGARKAD